MINFMAAVARKQIRFIMLFQPLLVSSNLHMSEYGELRT